MTVKEAQKKEEDKMEVDENTTLSPEELKLKAQLEAFELLVADIVNDCNLVLKGVQQSDDRLIGRALRQAFHMRKQFSRQLFEHVFVRVIKDSERRPILQTFLSAVPEDETKMEITEEPAAPEEGSTEKIAEQKPKKPIQYPVEVDVFLQLLLIAFLIDKKLIGDAVKAANDLITFVQSINRRTMSVLAAKAYFYFSRAYELNKELASIRPVLLNALRNASLRQDNQIQAMVINLLLRNYLADNLYDQANKLLTKTPSLEIKSTSQLARFLYYKGKIKSVQLDYSEAYDCLMTAIRKAPATSAKGFRVAAFKLAIIVKLLMGEIPERSVFSQPELKTALKPYFELTKFVRIGDLLQFREVVEQNSAVYKRDKTYTLIQRIRQNVIRTGLKKISLSYSRISFQDICSKLHLDNPEDVEMIVAKAIKDGIIDATIDHEGGFVRSRETVDVYSTSEPAESFDKRIGFCLQIHDECVKALRYPPETEKKMKKELEGAEERRVSEEELAEELAEDDGEDDEF